ncbi:MAG TPA: RidA family protein [Burkholderiales bacterium]|jgi:enamine deaminase RidA (YjgF/YER057c/UK114 family)|nr:RidA family protein [Burkholderiales bacterium]
MKVDRFHVGARLSEMAIHHGTVYLAGQIAEDASQDMGGQTQQVLAQIDKLLMEAGTDKTRVLMAQIFCADMRLFGEMNKVWDAWVVAGQTPPRATIEAKLATPKHLVEIVVTAAQK